MFHFSTPENLWFSDVSKSIKMEHWAKMALEASVTLFVAFQSIEKNWFSFFSIVFIDLLDGLVTEKYKKAL